MYTAEYAANTMNCKSCANVTCIKRVKSTKVEILSYMSLAMQALHISCVLCTVGYTATAMNCNSCSSK